MALIKCPDCGKEFSEYAECCPECGCPVDAAKENHVEEKPQEKTIQSISEVSSPPQQHIEYNQVERPIEQKAQKNRVLYIVLGIVLLCAIGTGVNYFCCSEDLLINKEHAGEKLALATGLITPEMSETQKQERLSDTTFAHFLNNKAVTEITRQYIVLENPIGELLSQTEIEKSGMCESGELHTAKVIVKNNTNNEIPGTAYSVVFFSIEWLRNGIEGEYNKTSEIKTVQGITIAPHSNATVMIDDNSFLGGSSHVGMNYVAKLKMDISNPVFLEFYRPTGNEYNEYQADKEQVTTRNADNLFVYEGSWESPKFGSQPCRLSYTKNGETISNAQYTNLKYDAIIPLNGYLLDGVLSFVGSVQNKPIIISLFYDENYIIGIGQDECHEDFNVEIELNRINKKNHESTEKPTVPTEYSGDEDGCLSLHLTGFIGGGEDATFIYDRQTDSGSVGFTINGIYNKRTVKNATYDSKTGRLVIEEYFINGKYIGDFVGTYKNGIYSGVFTNKNTGGKVDFKLSTQGHV